MNFIQELKQIGLRQKRVEFFEEYGFIPEIDDLDIEENSEMLDAINMHWFLRYYLYILPKKKFSSSRDDF